MTLTDRLLMIEWIAANKPLSKQYLMALSDREIQSLYEQFCLRG